MSGASGRSRPPAGNVVLGVARLARGRPDGFNQFGGTREAFLTSLAPLVAFPLVGGVLMLLGGGGQVALVELLATLCALLTPPVVSFELARRWGREDAWPRFATAFNWCQWAIPVVGSLVLMVLALATTFGLSRRAAAMLTLAALAAYAFWLHWFLARHGLGLSRARAFGVVLAINLASVAVVWVPGMLAGAVDGGK